jgi:DNA (cytosine-5)-methyltransferase 1
MQPTFYEFFAGGGMARAGLGKGWRCLFANDIDPKKSKSYVENWGDAEFHLNDIFKLNAADLPGQADLAWASFPCQDLSLAGLGAGLAGERSGAFGGFDLLLHALRNQGRAPRMLVIENVVGTITSRHGRDFEAICRSLHVLGYVFGALTIDAAHFLPQSRPRLFIVAVRKDVSISRSLIADEPGSAWASAALCKAHAALRPDLRKAWRWWRLPPPPKRNAGFDQLIDESADVSWHSQAETDRLIAMMSDVNRAKLQTAIDNGGRLFGTVYRRTRLDAYGEKVQRAEIRFDGVAGCLRTPEGGSSRQTVVMVENGRVRSRLMTAREAARLMGVAEDYRLPTRYNEAYHLLGDGVAVPVVRFLAESLLSPVVRSSKLALVAA